MVQIEFKKELAREINAGVAYGRVLTRDGFPVRLLSWDAKGRYPLVGLVDLGEQEYSRQWTLDGKADYRGHVKSNYDLVLETEGGEG